MKRLSFSLPPAEKRELFMKVQIACGMALAWSMVIAIGKDDYVGALLDGLLMVMVVAWKTPSFNGGSSMVKVSPGMVVQLNPETVKNPMFAGCLMVVTEEKKWGAQGYVQALGQDGKMGGQAYYRAEWDEMEPCGYAKWTVE